ncbi:hypothetical protein GCM10011588_31570 [Nocardia jinanensis]|uniref:Uncharacterized protein n=1 Tax=Nocardia jinanensis TaxID=382504 RepID=A0A917RMW5_9NOCA|nr:hypothetical protein GCM10011588_31570 [Nocardia jinanensis]
MVTRTVVTPTGTYRTVEGERLRTEALVVIALLDEWTGAAPEQVRALSRTPCVRAHVTDGYLVLTGVPARAMPGLATADRTVTVRIERRGHRNQDVDLVVPSGSDLPWFGPALALDSAVVAVAGRVREADHPNAPVPGAALEFRGAAGGQLVALRAPLAFAHEAGIAVSGCALTPIGTATAGPAASGSIRVVVTPSADIGGGTVLALGPPEREEHVIAARVEPGNTVVLRIPLARTVIDGTPVRLFGAGGLSAPTMLARAVHPGDGVIVSAAASTAGVIEVSDGARTELRATGLRSDTDGRWRLDGVRGIPRVTLTVSAPGLTTVGPVVHLLSAAADPNVIDIDLPA